ncbi:MAG: glycine zipper family protein [Sphingobacteriales bacterium]|nr:MAG: glycine zipper family protein [Sphingobacteriales bacterium]
MKQFIAILLIAVTAASCNSATSKEDKAVILAQQIAHQRSLDSMETAMTTQRVVDSMNAVTATAKTKDANKPMRLQTRTVYVNNNSEPASNNTQPVATANEKKGWSAKAKGAVIGAGVGAVTGAMVSEKKGKGAIIGGVLGAGAGVGVGAVIDNKQGR